VKNKRMLYSTERSTKSTTEFAKMAVESVQRAKKIQHAALLPQSRRFAAATEGYRREEGFIEPSLLVWFVV